MIIGSKNKGDWGEFYALLYLLATGRLYSADEKLNPLKDYYFPIIQIMRDEKRKGNIVEHIDYVITESGGLDKVEIYVDSILRKTIDAKEFQNEAQRLKADICSAKGQQLEIIHAEEFLNDIFLERLAAPATEVTDINMRVRDTNTGRNQDMGFSIKSYFGGAPTLLNASPATNFVYEVKGLTKTQMELINAIDTKSKISDRIEKMTEFGGELFFRHVANEVFSSNLMMIDSLMERVLAEMLLYSYQTGIKKCNAVIENVEKMNPLHYPRTGLYSYKFKKFLCAKALGMEPAKEWNGIDESNGGYIVVKADGNVVAYHIYNRDKFEQYLLDNTYFERGSTTRHQYATIYEEDGRMYMKLNLQIRFL